MSETQKCNRCKVNLPIENFNIKRCGNRMKQCMECNEKSKIRNERHNCEHSKRPDRCGICNGLGTARSKCEHGVTSCRMCHPSRYCVHDREKNRCKECGGSGICEHNKERRFCKECGGSGICECGKLRRRCGRCGIKCPHDRFKHQCQDCSPIQNFVAKVRHRVGMALHTNKTRGTMEYLECSVEELKEHLETQFKDGMSWDNYGSEWHIDHIVPIKYGNPTLEEVIERLHYTNLQPLWATDNMSKGNRFIG